MNDIELDEEMDMPCPCQKCGEWFDLNDGTPSGKWYPKTVICEKCGVEEEKEMDIDNEIEELKEQISNAEFTKKEAEERLIEILKIEPWRNIDNDINFVEFLFKSESTNE